MKKYVISCLMIVICISELNAQKSAIKSVKIGSQVWMAKNLDVTTFRNGDLIPEAKTIELWRYYDDNKLPAFCYFNHDKKTKDKYGVIYNRFVTNDPRGIAPNGWKVPDRGDWDILKQNVGGSQNGRSLMSKSGWFKNFNGINSTGFNAPPAGAYEPYGNRFRNNYETHFIIANEPCAYFSLNASGNIQDNGSWCVGMYIRCIQDSIRDDNQTEELKNVSLKYSESNKTQFVHRIGDYKYGGIIYELWKDEEGIENGMVVSLNDLSSNQSWTNAIGRIGWKATSRDNGLKNSTAIINQKGHTESAAKLCLDYSYAGYDDWFLPAIEDLYSIYKNEKILNNTLSKVENADQIASMIYQYWSSTESVDGGNPIVFEFYFGKEMDNNDRNYKMYNISTRAVRLFKSNSVSSNRSTNTKNVETTHQIIDTNVTIIHGQTWMSKNLDVSRFRNGDLIPHISSAEEWKTTKSPAWCYYNNDSLVGKQNGKLYNWYAVTDPRGIAPKGWHIPTVEEVHLLTTNLVHAYNAGKVLNTRSGWDAADIYGFNALAGGFRRIDGLFESGTYWWTKSYTNEYDYSLGTTIQYGQSFLMQSEYKNVKIVSHPKNRGMFIRCIKD